MMESIDVIQLLGYASVLVCFAFAGYFLRDVAKKRASLWWAAGFLLSACGSSILMITSYGLNRSYLSAAFALIAAAMAFFYYAASLLFFNRKSFFREKFAVVLFLVSIVLFVLPVYVLPEEYTIDVMKSSEMALFAVAFLVITVVFNRVTIVLGQKPRKWFKVHICRWLGALLFLVWIIAFWCLYVALFLGSIIAIGLIIVLSLLLFVLLWYKCRGGDTMIEKDEDTELSIQRIDSVGYKIKRDIDSARANLNDAMRKIGDVLLFQLTAKDEEGRCVLQENVVGRDEVATSAFEELKRKNKMVTRASTIGMREDELAVHVVELAEAVLGLARSAYENPSLHQSGRADFSKFDGDNSVQPNGEDPSDEEPLGPPWDTIPLDEECGGMGSETNGFSGQVSGSGGSGKIEMLATQALLKSSTDRDMIIACCELVISICNVENSAVTKMTWKGLSDEEHPGGIIGHTYNILRYYDLKTGTDYASAFRVEFQGDPEESQEPWKADGLLVEAAGLRTDSNELTSEVLSWSPTPDPDEATNAAENAASYLSRAIVLLEKACDLISRASEFLRNLPTSFTSAN